ncbi:MAG: cold shock domain-containing protein [Erysipelotrichaceae bacterium]|nr:cold shock domain-containing protein [Erysipelotrichaceae bacterium]
MQGKVKWFNSEKGFGFIAREEGKDIFVHYSQIVQDGYKTLNEGELVEFEIFQSDRGLQAKNVVRV